MTKFAVRLRAGIEAKKFRYGYPWIYSNDIISDRRSKAIIPGSFCKLVDYEKNPICLVDLGWLLEQATCLLDDFEANRLEVDSEMPYGCVCRRSLRRNFRRRFRRGDEV